MPYRDDADALEHRLRTLEAEAARVEEELVAARALLAETLERRKLPVVENLRAAARCAARWDDMAGDERVRACATCGQNVHELSGLTRTEAGALLGASFTGHYFRRDDGRVMTADCPAGLARRRRRKRAGLAFAAVALAAVGAFAGLPGEHREKRAPLPSVARSGAGDPDWFWKTLWPGPPVKPIEPYTSVMCPGVPSTSEYRQRK